MTIEELIKAKGKGLSKYAYVVPDIPEKKLNNAIVGMTQSTVEPEYVVAIIDTTLFGKSDDGFLFTGDAMYWHPIGDRRVVVKFADLKSAEVCIDSETDNKGRVKEKKRLRVVDKDDHILIDETVIMIEMEAMADFLNEVVKIGSENEAAFEMTKQVVPLSDSDPEIKLAYVQLVANFAFSDDGSIDGDEFAAIYSLMVRNDYSESARLELRSYMFDQSHMIPTNKLVEDFKELVPVGSVDTIMPSLIKDCIYMYYRKVNAHKKAIAQDTYSALDSWKSNKFIADLASKLNVNDDKVQVLVDAIKNDEDTLAKRKTDSDLAKAAKEIAAKAAAVGLPIAAVYFSGSVVGLSAAGITSGLASIGLGFGMVGGIGVAVLVGVGAYKAVKFFAGSEEVEACKQRELMIQDIIKNNQKTINYLVSDTNMISSELFKAIEAGNQSKEKIEKLKKLLAMLNKAASATTGNIIYGAKEQVIAKLPKELKRNKFDRLTDSPTKIKTRPFVYEVFPERIESKKDSNGKVVVEKVYPLDDTLPCEKYETALKMMKAVGYLNKD